MRGAADAGSSWRRWVRRLGPWVLASVAIVALLYRYPIEDIAAHLGAGTWWPVIALGAAGTGAALFAVAFADHAVIRGALGGATYADVIAGKAATSLMMIVDFLASGGLYGVWVARKTRAGLRSTVGVMLYIAVSDLAALALLVTASVWLAGDALPPATIGVLRVLAPAIACPVIALAWLGPVVVPRLAPGRLLLRPWAQVRPVAYTLSLLARIAVIAIYITTCWAAANGFGLRLPFAAVCTYLPIILLVGALPVNVAGFGAVQVAWLVFDAWAPGEQILAFQFLWRLAATAGLIARGAPFLRRVTREIAGSPPGPAAPATSPPSP